MVHVTLSPLDARIPQWNFDDLIERCCPICGSSGHPDKYQRPDGLRVKECANCLTHYVSPTPSSAQLDHFYQTYDANHRRNDAANLAQLRASYEATNPLADFRVRELSSLIQFNGAKVLDVGFGRAFFLYCLGRLGAEPHGLEVDPDAIQFARSLGIKAYQGNFHELEFPTKYDVILMLDLIEHPLQPMDLMSWAMANLLDGGLLVIWTPNGAAKQSIQEPVTFRVDLEHMQYFSPQTCVHAAHALGLHIAHLETLGYPWLENIDAGKSAGDGTLLKKSKARIKTMVKQTPGYSALAKLRHAFDDTHDQERAGDYHLFCIMQKPVAH